jgi:hypothetical protein
VAAAVVVVVVAAAAAAIRVTNSRYSEMHFWNGQY